MCEVAPLLSEYFLGLGDTNRAHDNRSSGERQAEITQNLEKHKRERSARRVAC